MQQIGDFFGSFLGYILWPLYSFFHNYGVAIILFTIILKFLLLPFSLKQQKSMAASGKLAAKQKELQKKYANDRVKLNEEMQKLYSQEGVKPGGGCLMALIPFPIMIGIYYTVINPLTNVLHIAGQRVSEALTMLQQIPAVGASFSTNTFYNQMNLIRHFDDMRPYLTMFSDQELNQIDTLSQGFNFLGLNLLGTPSGSDFSTMLWLIPALCLLSSLATRFFTMRLQPGMQQQQGCMKVMLYALPLFTAWIAFTTPAAVGFYWIISTLTTFAQTLLMHKFYSPAHITARAEAQRIALLEQEEAAVKELPPEVQKQLAAKTEEQRQARINANQKNQAKQAAKGKSKGSKSGKSGNRANNNTDSYLGSKK